MKKTLESKNSSIVPKQRIYVSVLVKNPPQA
jgi:hypothetical protein